MNIWLNRIGIGLITAVVLVLILKFMHFSFWTLIVLPLMLGGLTWALEHRNFAWGIFLGTLIFTLFMSIFGWTIMEGWVKPEDFFKK